MIQHIQYSFSSTLWRHTLNKGSWHFVSLPSDITQEIRDNFRQQEKGWGQLKVIAKVYHIEWKTSIWYDSKLSTYLLPIKNDIRFKCNISIDETIFITLWL